MAQSLADYLGTVEKSSGESVADIDKALDPKLSAKDFCVAVVESLTFRRHIVRALALGTIPAPIVLRLMEYAIGKPVERVEHTGKDGSPIETVSEVRRTIVHVNAGEPELEESVESLGKTAVSKVTH